MSRPKGSKLTEKHKKRISKAQEGKKGYWYGKKMTKKTREKMSRSAPRRMGEDNPNWKGDSIGYEGVHSWLEREYGRPQKCEGND